MMKNHEQKRSSQKLKSFSTGLQRRRSQPKRRQRDERVFDESERRWDAAAADDEPSGQRVAIVDREAGVVHRAAGEGDQVLQRTAR